MTSDGEMKTKVIVVDYMYSVIVENFFYLNSFTVPNIHFKIRKNEYEGNEHAL